MLLVLGYVRRPQCPSMVPCADRTHRGESTPTLQYSTVQYSAVQTTVQYSTGLARSSDDAGGPNDLFIETSTTSTPRCYVALTSQALRDTD